MSAVGRLRRALVVTHRWLGIAGGLLFVMWFATGIVMMYARMPELDARERLARLEPLDLSTVGVSPAAAAARAGAPDAEGARIAMLAGRPVYRFGTRTVWADTGEPLGSLGKEAALSVVGAAWPERAGTLRPEGLLEAPNQWTLQNRADLPLHRIALGDPNDTRVYVSDRSGEIVMEATARERRWAYAGAVLHWIYFTPLRAHSGLWAQLIIWLSVAGCVLALSGLAWGLWSWWPRRRAGSPYGGLLGWHHYAGLLFGLFSFTWILSGLLSMDPWSWHPGTAATAAQREAVAGPRAGAVEVERLRAAAPALAASGFAPREALLVRFRGEPYLAATGATPDARRLVSLAEPEHGPFARFADADLLEAAARAMPASAIVEARRLDAYDAYYYDRSGLLPLPVLRVRYDDPPR
ncbi:MAG TPA: PepSY domain-containing protein, partial [Longimicrobiales bacterium]|nr:PepSY domain-containing protein [Longimicrobiales bacterium]